MVMIDVKTSSINPLTPQFQEAMKLVVNETTVRLKAELQKNSPVKEGLLQGSWFLSETSDYRNVISNSREYADYVDKGTQPHDILPKDKKALYWEGAPHPYRVVHHPGYAGAHFVDTSITTVESEIEEIFIKACVTVGGQ